MAVGADVFAVNQVAEFKVGQFLGQGDGVKRVAGRAEYGGDLRRSVFEGLDAVLAMVEYDAGKRVVYAVVDIIAALAVALGLADYFGHQRGGRSHQEPAGLGQDFDIFRKEAVEFGINAFGQFPKGLHAAVIPCGKAAADIQQLQVVAALLGFFKNARRQVQGLHVVFKVGGLTADVET